MIEKTHRLKIILISLISLTIGALIYRYSMFALLYLEQKKIEKEAKKISLEYREIFLWYQQRKELIKPTSVGRPKIVIEIETD
jgi:hypothetical protein